VNGCNGEEADVNDWLERREDWLGKRDQVVPGPAVEKVYSVESVGHLLDVKRKTVYKWLSHEDNDGGVIPPEAWFKLPNGQIRIREWIVLKLLNGEV
jgi:hypothetical protein